MFREIAQIVLAINLSSSIKLPPPARVESWAHTIQEEAIQSDIDPLIEVAIITHESQWRERAISHDHLDYGLMQIRAKFHGPHPEWLLDGNYNIKIGNSIIRKSIEICQRYLKREPNTQEWLSVYQGSLPSCRKTKLTKIVEDFYLCLVRNVEQDVEDGPLSDCREVYWPVHRKVKK